MAVWSRSKNGIPFYWMSDLSLKIPYLFWSLIFQLQNDFFLTAYSIEYTIPD